MMSADKPGSPDHPLETGPVTDRDQKDDPGRKKLLKARTTMVLEHPFFASLALRLDLKADFDCHTAYTDGRVFGYNPNYIKILFHENDGGCMDHQIAIIIGTRSL